MPGNKTSPSQAEQAARVNKNRKATATSNKNNAATPRKAPAAAKKTTPLSSQSLMGLINAVLFLLMCGMAFDQEGKLFAVFRNLFFGIFGKGAFYVAVFAPLYLAASFLHRTKKNVPFKTRCVIIFIISFGVLHHLFVNNATLGSDASVVSDLYFQGKVGGSGGLVCGLIALMMRWAMGKTFSIIATLLILIVALLGAMEITIPRICSAIQDLYQNNPGTGSNSDEPDPAEDLVKAVHRAVNKFRSRPKKNKRKDKTDDDFWDVEPEPAKKKPVDDIWEDDDQEDEDEVIIKNPLKDFFTKKKNQKAKNPSDPDIDDKKKPLEPDVPVSKAAPEPEKADDNYPFFDEEPVAQKKAAPVKADPAVRKVTADEAAASAMEVSAQIEKAKAAPKVVYKYPPIDLLNNPARSNADGTMEMRRNTIRLNETLASFKIDARIENATRGPSVTRYEVKLAQGVRMNKLTTVADDIALSLGVSNVRIAPVPGKISVVGIEVPNQAVTTVALREVIDSREFKNSSSKSTFSVGKDIGGNCIVGNIAKMPHMLIAGTTGSGKSVCMNSIIISLLYKAAPEEVKLIMVDPKMVELGIYNDIPHLLIPVVTDPKKAAGSLQWAVTEMMRRYKMMSDAGVRDLESFNSIVESEQEGDKLPQVVIIIDELADLMLVAAKEVEDSICRIAQMGRAAGMHLIIATQRPSADVITGLMKANIPSRIAFSVASAMESRIILDTQGAEKLVGKGDMLFAPIGTGKPQRVQGCFVTDGEVEAVATFVKENFKPSYDESIMDEIEKSAQMTGKKSAAPEPEANADELEGDEMLPQAVEVILDTKQASVSMLQRRLKLGYARAARIMDEMEEKGIVGCNQGSKPREILITREKWDAKKRQLYPNIYSDEGKTSDDLPF